MSTWDFYLVLRLMTWRRINSRSKNHPSRVSVMQLIYSRAHLDLEHVTYRLIYSTMSTINSAEKSEEFNKTKLSHRRRGSYRVYNKKITLACKPCSICPIYLRNAALGICAICTQTVFHSWSSCTSESLSFWAKRGRYCPSSLGRRKLWWNTNIGAIPFLWSELWFSICK